MRKPKNSTVATKTENVEIIEIDSDTDDDCGGRMLAICGEVNASLELPNTLAVYNETNLTSTQIDCDPALDYDLDYLKYLTISGENANPYLLEDHARESSPMRLTYNVDNSSKGREVEKKKSRAGRKPKSHTIPTVSKRLKIDNGKADRKSSSKTVAKPKKGKALRGRKKKNVKSKSTSHVKDNSTHNFKACKKKNEADKSYVYYLAYLRNSITIFRPERQLRRKRDPDIIISDHPFADAPFETNKDEKVIDLEDAIELGKRFNSLFCKKLMKTLRKPYDKNEFSKLYQEASRKRPLTRSRQLRDGKEIEYKVDHLLRPSYLQLYPDLNRKYRHCRKDRLRGLNLLRGFFFYLQNVILDGSFQPWKYEKDLNKLCSDDRRCTDIVFINNPTLPLKSLTTSYKTLF